MKRLIALLIMIAFTTGFVAVSLGAQAADAPKLPGSSKDLYIKTLYVMKVYPHSLGYRVDYLTSGGFVATTYLPLKWFYNAAAKGELVEEVNPSVPYMEVVFDAGKFRMVRLHVSPSYSDRGWGSLSSAVNIDDKFKVDAPELVY